MTLTENLPLEEILCSFELRAKSFETWKQQRKQNHTETSLSGKSPCFYAKRYISSRKHFRKEKSMRLVLK